MSCCHDHSRRVFYYGDCLQPDRPDEEREVELLIKNLSSPPGFTLEVRYV